MITITRFHCDSKNSETMTFDTIEAAAKLAIEILQDFEDFERVVINENIIEDDTLTDNPRGILITAPEEVEEALQLQIDAAFPHKVVYLSESAIKEIGAFMAEAIFDDVTRDSMPHRLSSHDGSKQAWLLKQIGEPLMSCQGGAAWDMAELKLKRAFPGYYSTYARICDLSQESSQLGDVCDRELNRLNSHVQTLLQVKADALRDEIESSC